MNLLLNTNSFCSDEDFTDIRIAFFDCKWQCKRIRQFDVRQSRFDWIVDADKFRAPNGPFFGENSRILPGSTVTGNGNPVTTVTWFLATFSGSVAREGEFPGDEVEHGGHVFHRPVPASFALHG